jgi:hypothetical protein
MRPAIRPLIQVSSLMVAAVVSTGCTNGTPVSPSAALPSAAGAQASGLTLDRQDHAAPTAAALDGGPAFSQSSGAPVDVSGTWATAGELLLIVPEWVAELILGIDPEGPRTHIRCTFSGTLELVQNGDTFTGTEMQDPNQCVTRGGQVFQEPGGPVSYVDGRVRGRSVSFAIDDFPVFCPQQLVISGVENGVANRMSGTGRCIVPGHPQSPHLDLPPPPAGVSKVLNSEYWRP